MEETVHCFTRDVVERLQQQQNEKSIEAFNQKVELIPLKLNSLHKNTLTFDDSIDGGHNVMTTAEGRCS